MASIHDILRPITFTKTISRVSAASNVLLNFFGMQVGGSNERSYGHGREGSYHVFNNTRKTAIETSPNMPAAKRPVLPVGRVPFVYPRMHEEFELSYEFIHNLAKIDDPKTRDTAGEAYIRRQSLSAGQRHSNWRSALLVGMLRDSLYLHESGDYWYPSYTSSGSLAQRNFQLPAGNKDQLDIADLAGTSINGSDIIDVSWDNPGANIPLHCQLIDAALFRRNGVHLRHIFLRSLLWDQVTNNDYVAAGHGIANPPFQSFTRNIGTNPDGSPMQMWTGTLNKVPGVEWHILNDGRDLGPPGSEAWADDIEAGHALFLPDPSPELFEGLIGSEPIVAPYGQSSEIKTGFAAWTKLVDNPSMYEAFILDNFMPCPYIPGSWCYGDLVF